MAKINHPYETNKGNIVRSGANNLKVSTKNSIEICRFIKGMGLDDAVSYMEGVVDKKKAVPFRRFIRDQAHRKGLGPGRFPVNAAKEFISLLNNAKNNADVKGLDTERLVVYNAQANIGAGRHYRGGRMFGRRFAKSTNISLTVRQKRGSSKKNEVSTKKKETVKPASKPKQTKVPANETDKKPSAKIATKEKETKAEGDTKQKKQ